MNKKQFKTFMKEFKSINEAGDKLNEAFRVFDPNFNVIFFSRYKKLIYNKLFSTMND